MMREKELEIIFEDNHLIAVFKPSGTLTQPSGTVEEGLEGFVKTFIKNRDNKPGNVFLEAIHRLDRPVCGIVVFAKTSKALSRLQMAMREKKIRKFYAAKVEGTPPKEGETLVHYLVKGDHKTAVVSASNPDAKRAELQIITSQGNGVVVELKTGRYHQIRAQLSAYGSPVLGDTKYGAKPILKDSIALKHVKMELPHPIGGKEITLVLP